jgi:hypothetical protein
MAALYNRYIYIYIYTHTHSGHRVLLKADSHIACCAHAVPLRV